MSCFLVTEGTVSDFLQSGGSVGSSVILPDRTREEGKPYLTAKVIGLNAEAKSLTVEDDSGTIHHLSGEDAVCYQKPFPLKRW